MTIEEITKIKEFLANPKLLNREQIIESIPIKSEVVRVSRITKRTKSKKLMRYQLVVVSGNSEIGIVGMGVGKNQEYKLALREGIVKSKRKLKLVNRGCGFIGCPCNGKIIHSIPSRKTAKIGSTLVQTIPASLKTGLRGSPVAKKLLSLAGISDLAIVTKGNKNNKLNMAKAIYDAI
jgi:ribosomal protein S5